MELVDSFTPNNPWRDTCFRWETGKAPVDSDDESPVLLDHSFRIPSDHVLSFLLQQKQLYLQGLAHGLYSTVVENIYRRLITIFPDYCLNACHRFPQAVASFEASHKDFFMATLYEACMPDDFQRLGLLSIMSTFWPTERSYQEPIYSGISLQQQDEKTSSDEMGKQEAALKEKTSVEVVAINLQMHAYEPFCPYNLRPLVVPSRKVRENAESPLVVPARKVRENAESWCPYNLRRLVPARPDGEGLERWSL
ncbi:hypothetical protein C8J56DRAFT_1067632 [Mycena floridula]|nr:hypothetical protein C8J56DRAFT_1067632 [Mycena floridula]